MKAQEAAELIERAVVDRRGGGGQGPWADLGAGSGTFTFALAALLGSGREVMAVDREAAALAALRQGMEARARERGPDGRPDPVASIAITEGDFTDLEVVQSIAERPLAGALFANALHFDADPGRTLRAWADRLAPGGRLVVVEYEDRPPNPWVPHPLPTARLRDVAEEQGLTEPTVVGERPSSYGGVLYCAWLEDG